jgi:hypothetical protein
MGPMGLMRLMGMRNARKLHVPCPLRGSNPARRGGVFGLPLWMKGLPRGRFESRSVAGWDWLWGGATQEFGNERGGGVIEDF